MKNHLVGVALVVALSACEAEQDVDFCSVEPSSSAQAIALIATELRIHLDETLGGLECVPGNLEACQQRLEQQCVGELDATVGTEHDVAVVLTADYGTVTVESVTVTSDCGWSLDNTNGFGLDQGTPVPIAVHFEARDVGVCEGRLAIISNEGSARELGTDTIVLRATVAAAG